MTTQRGRKSTDAQVTRPVVAFRKEPPAPPVGMNSRAEQEWRTVTERLPSDWFSPETFAILRAHCEAVAECEALQEMIETVRPYALSDDESHTRYRQLLRMKDQAARLALTSATKLRLTPQSRILPRKAGSAADREPTGARPWEWESEQEVS